VEVQVLFSAPLLDAVGEVIPVIQTVDLVEHAVAIAVAYDVVHQSAGRLALRLQTPGPQMAIGGHAVDAVTVRVEILLDMRLLDAIAIAVGIVFIAQAVAIQVGRIELGGICRSQGAANAENSAEHQ
jgi:hypothetical protein